MQSAAIHGQRGLFDDLCEARVGMGGTRDVFGTRTELYGHREFCQQVTGVSPENVGSQDAIGLLIRQNLHPAFGGADGARATVGLESSDLVALTPRMCSDQASLVPTIRRDLGRGRPPTTR